MANLVADLLDSSSRNHITGMIRAVRNLAALACLTVSWGMTALWVRSYWRIDELQVTGRVAFSSLYGVSSAFGVLPPAQMNDGRTGLSSAPTVQARRSYVDLLTHWSFRYHEVEGVSQLQLPHWFVALVCSLFAFALKPTPRLRFSLADFLILMTMSALLLAGAAGLPRLAA
jgi:hypothetical protein